MHEYMDNGSEWIKILCMEQLTTMHNKEEWSAETTMFLISSGFTATKSL